MSKQPHFEVVRTDAGWHARFRASNGRVIMASEVYGRRRDAVRAIAIVGDAPRYSDGKDADLIEVRDVDERGSEPVSWVTATPTLTWTPGYSLTTGANA